MIKRLVLFAIISIFIHCAVYAGNTRVIRVSCIIPAIPGVNVPEVAEPEEETAQEETQTQDQDFITQTEEKEEENTRIIVRTMVAK